MNIHVIEILLGLIFMHIFHLMEQSCLIKFSLLLPHLHASISTSVKGDNHRDALQELNEDHPCFWHTQAVSI